MRTEETVLSKCDGCTFLNGVVDCSHRSLVLRKDCPWTNILGVLAPSVCTCMTPEEGVHLSNPVHSLGRHTYPLGFLQLSGQSQDEVICSVSPGGRGRRLTPRTSDFLPGGHPLGQDRTGSGQERQWHLQLWMWGDGWQGASGTTPLLTGLWACTQSKGHTSGRRVGPQEPPRVSLRFSAPRECPSVPASAALPARLTGFGAVCPQQAWVAWPLGLRVGAHLPVCKL